MDTLLESDPDIRKAHKVYQEFSQNSEYRELYEARMKWKRDQATRLDYEKRKAVEETRLETARKLLKMGMFVDDISEATGLSVEVIEGLSQEDKKS